MFTQAQIDAATQDEAVRIGLAIEDAQLEAFRASAADEKALMARIATALERPAAGNKKQQLWADLYAMHLKTRLGPAIINSTTADTVIRDLVLDSVQMTNDVYPLAKQQMAALDSNPADWT